MYPTGAPPALAVSDPAHLPVSWSGAAGESPEYVAAKQRVFSLLVNRYCMGCHRTNPKTFANYELFKPLAAEQDGVALLSRYTTFDPADAQRKTLVAMPQSQLMFNELNGLDTPADFPTHGLAVTPEQAQHRQDARDAIFDWLLQSSDPFRAQTQVTFQVDQADGTQVGDYVVIVGDIPELGRWNPVQGVRCEGTRFPTWTVSHRRTTSASGLDVTMRYVA